MNELHVVGAGTQSDAQAWMLQAFAAERAPVRVKAQVPVQREVGPSVLSTPIFWCWLASCLLPLLLR